MGRDRLNQMLSFAESLSQDPNGEEILKRAIGNMERLKGQGEKVGSNLKILKEIKKLCELIPQKGKERNN